jgi:hypothetical protein
LGRWTLSFFPFPFSLSLIRESGSGDVEESEGSRAVP